MRDPYCCFAVRRVVSEGRVGVTLILDGEMTAEPGQFVMVWLPGVEERPFAVVSERPLMISVQVVGPFTRTLASRQVGDRVWVRGPYGRGFILRGRRHLLIGGGSGIASLALLAQKALERGDEVRVALGARTAEAFLLTWHLNTLGCELLLATEDGSAGAKGTVLDAVRPILTSGWADQLYICGPRAMLRSAIREAKKYGAPCQVSLEEVMKCGLGVCGHCHCGEWLVCRDGPVFEADRVEATLEAEAPSPFERG